MAASLSLKDVNLHFGGVKVLQDVSFDVEPGVILGLVGPNGAGKTSLFNCISGHYKPSSGSISVMERRFRAALRPGWPAWAWPVPFSIQPCS
ncbi:ATP-binding cassette domain-containing protein [Pseudarthrobacter defluvii]|uniref:ATP-binding cassette domain-containing protein n=1 Tax=Pseudarthrobacter defluvii TaxID=410837 RepID=UPI002574B62A|nr:ATP-binding cassette domain-containing protein [Pseudarthrobacter defluvii]WJH24478.1 ATP-binding cassette domain-containing protein [Pseudarthrobacter defluvii]